MKILSIPSLNEIKNSTPGDALSVNNSKFEIIDSVFDLSVVENSVNVGQPSFEIKNNKLRVFNEDFYVDNVNFDNVSNISFVGTDINKTFKKIIANKITASIEFNNDDNDIIETTEDGLTVSKSSGFYKFKNQGSIFSTSNSGYKNRLEWKNNSTLVWDTLDNQKTIYFDLNYNFTTNNTHSLTFNSSGKKVTVRLPAEFSQGNLFKVIYSIDFYKDNFYNFDNLGKFNQVFQKSTNSTNDIQVISQYFGYSNNTFEISGDKVDIYHYSQNERAMINILYLGNNFFNYDFSLSRFSGNSAYEEKDMRVTNNYNQWLIMDF